MAPLQMSLNPQYRGDTWPGFTINSLQINQAVPTSNLASCRMQFRDKSKNLGYELTTETATCKGSITIVDPVLWVIKVNECILPLDAGMWWWDLETTDVNGRVLTVLTGRIRITADITFR